MNDPSRKRPGDTGSGVASFRHEAMFYEGEQGFLVGAVPFVKEGLEGDESILVVVDQHKIAALSDALGSWSGRLAFADMALVGQEPGADHLCLAALRRAGPGAGAAVQGHRRAHLSPTGAPTSWPSASGTSLS